MHVSKGKGRQSKRVLVLILLLLPLKILKQVLFIEALPAPSFLEYWNVGVILRPSEFGAQHSC
jgi:hypothetical protein